MLDFMMVASKMNKNRTMEIYPKFIIKKSNDLMIKGSDFYAIWNENKGLWSTSEQEAVELIDSETKKYYEEYIAKYGSTGVKALYLWDAESGMIDRWHKYVMNQLRDNFVILDEKLVFSDTPVDKKSYSSKRLSYPLLSGDYDNYDQLIGTLYSKEERHKLEWTIGSIINGDSTWLQKFAVLYGSAGTGKSTILNIIQQLFDGYYSVFDARALGNSSNVFALEAFKNNPLVGIQHDGDLSKIEDNTRINSLVSHELMTMNEKYKSTYGTSFKTFLYMGTNKPVKITDAKSGIIRRLIDISPSNKKLNPTEYRRCVEGVKFELGAIACKCKEVYETDKLYYDSYIPVSMMSASNDFYNFILDLYFTNEKMQSITLKRAWTLYKEYAEEVKMSYPMSQRIFKEEMKNYFYEFKERYVLEDGTRARNVYIRFKLDMLEVSENENTTDSKIKDWLDFKEQESIFDEMRRDCCAQLTTENGTPLSKWDNVSTTLKDIDTKELHFVRVPENHIVIDFDLKNSEGDKDLSINKKEALKWPKTYAELSKSGNGIHLHYIYSGDVKELQNVYSDGIEIKVYTGNSSLRRKLTKCTSEHVHIISGGLPKKKGDKVVNTNIMITEKGIRDMITRNLIKEFHPGTKPSMDFIKKILDDAYDSGVSYDVSDMFNELLIFASSSTNQKDNCMKILKSLKLKSKDADEIADIQNIDVISDSYDIEDNLHFYDIEVFPNVNFVNYKKIGNNPMIRLINPTPEMIEELVREKIIGFHNRGYDNHILYAMMMGMTPEQIYKVSKSIIGKIDGSQYGAAYNLSYTDIYDYMSAGNKMSLKKWQLKLGIPHKELGLDWDEPVPKELWPLVSEYCDNDVLSTEAVFFATKDDWIVRKMLSKATNLSRNDTTNTLTKKLIFGNDKTPQNVFRYRDLSQPVPEIDEEMSNFLTQTGLYDVKKGFDDKSILPYFPGYKFEFGKSTYRGHNASEGGFVLSKPGVYSNVGLMDVDSEHPHSAMCEYLFGHYTWRYYDLVATRMDIKKGDIETAKTRLDGIFKEFLEDSTMNPKNVSLGAKTPINSAYGLTCASFPNPFKDPRNVDNIVAKRGALFMIDLYEAITAKGWDCIHVKTDSVKIADIDDEKIAFIHAFGKKYGYKFTHEATYSQFALFNKACYVAKHSGDSVNGDKVNKWTTTGMPISHPYVVKSLFTNEGLEKGDYYELKSVRSTIYLDFNEEHEDVSIYEDELKKRRTLYLKGDSLKNPPKLNPAFHGLMDEDLQELVSKGHNYRFVGKNGNFLPIKEGFGGGKLMRLAEGGTYSSVVGTKGYRWKEADVVEANDIWNQVDYSYYEEIANGVKEDINNLYGMENGFEMFINGHIDEIPF